MQEFFSFTWVLQLIYISLFFLQFFVHDRTRDNVKIARRVYPMVAASDQWLRRYHFVG